MAGLNLGTGPSTRWDAAESDRTRRGVYATTLQPQEAVITVSHDSADCDVP
jgi:ABC-type uncharacterized transport system YnjBCD ATPase subunit